MRLLRLELATSHVEFCFIGAQNKECQKEPKKSGSKSSSRPSKGGPITTKLNLVAKVWFHHLVKWVAVV